VNHKHYAYMPIKKQNYGHRHNSAFSMVALMQ